MWEDIKAIYQQIGVLAKIDAKDNNITSLFMKVHLLCRDFLFGLSTVELTSRIPGKNYFAFSTNRQSRAVNADLFIDFESVERIILCLVNDELESTTPEEITRALYTIAISFCCVVDLSKDGDQKTPGTFFELFVSHWFARTLKVQPKKSIEVLNLDMKTALPTDYIFDLGVNRPKIHMPVKTSTRERVIQVWAHQRVLDGIYGTGRFLGMLVSLAETQVAKKQVVSEICLPDQWRLYQMFIAQLYRVYYLDIPNKYKELNRIFPPIVVRPLGEYFYEIKDLFSEY